MSLRLALCLLLTSVSFPLIAHDVRHLGANGDGGCVEVAARDSDAAAAPAAHPKSAAAAHRAVKPKTAVSRGGDGVSDVRPPRWHSFLPGMFR